MHPESRLTLPRKSIDRGATPPSSPMSIDGCWPFATTVASSRSTPPVRVESARQRSDRLDRNALNQSDQYPTHRVKVMQFTLQEISVA
jgi:hypothetical protein